MKKILLSSFFCCVCIAHQFVLAEAPVLTKSNMPAFETKQKLLRASENSLEVVDITIQGQNATWDFRNLEHNGSEHITIEYKDPSTSSFYSSFPSSNYLMTLSFYSINQLTNYVDRYYVLSDIKLDKIGYKYKDSATVSYTDYQTEFVFPLEVGTTNNDTWDNTASSFGGGNCNIACLGYGTLKLPDNKIYQNVMMLHTELDEIFTISMYSWYSENGVLLLEYSEPYFFNEGHAIYATNNDFSKIENPSFYKSISYNNPVQDVLNVKIENVDNNTSLCLWLTNSMGKTVSSTQISSFLENNSINFDLSNLTAGIYFLNLKSTINSEIETIKIIKQ